MTGGPENTEKVASESSGLDARAEVGEQPRGGSYTAVRGEKERRIGGGGRENNLLL